MTLCLHRVGLLSAPGADVSTAAPWKWSLPCTRQIKSFVSSFSHEHSRPCCKNSNEGAEHRSAPRIESNAYPNHTDSTYNRQKRSHANTLIACACVAQRTARRSETEQRLAGTTARLPASTHRLSAQIPAQKRSNRGIVRGEGADSSDVDVMQRGMNAGRQLLVELHARLRGGSLRRILDGVFGSLQRRDEERVAYQRCRQQLAYAAS